MTATIRIEITAGVGIEQAAAVARRIAKTLSVGVAFNFNGVECVAAPVKSTEQVADEYFRELSYRLEREKAELNT